jgi:small subunit ribosomal protein S2
MPVATRRELLEAGVHFGHQTRRWNPKMRRFIFGERSGIYIVDLEKTLTALERTYEFLVDIGRRSGVALFVGTKKQAQETVQEQATRVGMPFVNTRWLGGMLTNFQTIHARLRRMRELREMERSGAFEYLPKKEVLKLRHEKEKLERNLAGIQDMERLPDAVFVIDTKREAIAVKEARKLGIPVVAIVDTNCDPDEVDFVIPGNDDAIRSCSLITKVVADAIQEGQYLAYRGMQARTAEPEFEEEPVAPTVEPEQAEEVRRPIRLSEEEAAFFGAALEGPDAGEDIEPELGSAAEEESTSAEGESAGPVPDAAGEGEGPEGSPAPRGPETSASWAAPSNPSDLEAATIPSQAGTSDLHQIEQEVDREAGQPATLPGGVPGVVAQDTTRMQPEGPGPEATETETGAAAPAEEAPPTAEDAPPAGEGPGAPPAEAGPEEETGRRWRRRRRERASEPSDGGRDTETGGTP